MGGARGCAQLKQASGAGCGTGNGGMPDAGLSKVGHTTLPDNAIGLSRLVAQYAQWTVCGLDLSGASDCPCIVLLHIVIAAAIDAAWPASGSMPFSTRLKMASQAANERGIEGMTIWRGRNSIIAFSSSLPRSRFAAMLHRRSPRPYWTGSGCDCPAASAGGCVAPA